MVYTKKTRKAKQPLALRVIKIIVIVLSSGILLIACVKWIIHWFGHLTK